MVLTVYVVLIMYGVAKMDRIRNERISGTQKWDEIAQKVQLVYVVLIVCNIDCVSC